jgi:hypothetical protein
MLHLAVLNILPNIRQMAGGCVGIRNNDTKQQ